MVTILTVTTENVSWRKMIMIFLAASSKKHGMFHYTTDTVQKYSCILGETVLFVT